MNLAQKTIINQGKSAHDVLRLLFEKGAQRQGDIAKYLHITKSASNQHFKKLKDEGYIKTVKKQLNKHGRPSIFWDICADGNYFMGILINLEVISLTLIDFSGKKIKECSFSLKDKTDQEEFLKKLDKSIYKISSFVYLSSGRILQGFIGIPGTIKSDGTIINVPYLPALNGLNLEKEIEARFGLNFYADGKQYIGMQAEKEYLRTDSTTLILEWGNGVGGNIVCNYQILNWASVSTKHNRGLWNIGHIPIVKGGNPCYCGRNGCLEAYVSGAALLKAHPEWRCNDLHQLIGRAVTGDKVYLEPIGEAAKTLAKSLYWLFELFGIDSMILEGAFIPVFPFVEDSFRSGLEVMWSHKKASEFEINISDHSVEKIKMGSALVARHFYFNSEKMRKSRGVYHSPYFVKGSEDDASI